MRGIRNTLSWSETVHNINSGYQSTILCRIMLISVIQLSIPSFQHWALIFLDPKKLESEYVSVRNEK